MILWSSLVEDECVTVFRCCLHTKKEAKRKKPIGETKQKKHTQKKVYSLPGTQYIKEKLGITINKFISMCTIL